MWADTGNVRIGAGGKQNPPFLSASEYFHPIPHLEPRPLSRLFFLLPPGGVSPGYQIRLFRRRECVSHGVGSCSLPFHLVTLN
jgi:hypothetical protein